MNLLRRSLASRPRRVAFAPFAALLLASAGAAGAQEAPPADGAPPAAAPAPAVAAAAATQDDPAVIVRVPVMVTAVSGGGVYLDKGRDAHIEPGDVVVLHPAGAPMATGVVQSVSRTSCRASLPPGAPPVAMGDRGEVLVPEARTRPAPADAGGDAGSAKSGAVPEHPPWSAGEEGFDTGKPLLAPAFAQSAEQRPMRTWGRWFTQFNGTWDLENDNAFTLARTGLDLNVENPGGSPGLFHLLGDVSYRASDLQFGEDDRDLDGRLDRASYLWGGTREDRQRVEAGRFLQNAFPELGVLDGVEAARRTDSGDWLGASLGYMPLPFPSMKTGRDLQAAVYFRSGSESGRPEPLAFGLAYQNTWHEGSQDRNLLVGTLDAELSETVSFDASAEVDYYGPGGDTIHDDGLQITDAWARALWRPTTATGVGLHASRVRWPEMKRDEFGQLTDEQIANSAVTRLGADGWHDISVHLRVDGRLDAWWDDDDQGGSGNLRAALRDVAWERGEVALDVFGTDGTFTEGRGLRLSASRTFESVGYGTLSWEASTFTSGTDLDGNDDVSQQALRASLDTSLGGGWDLSLFAERRFGDDQSSFNLGLYLQERF